VAESSIQAAECQKTGEKKIFTILALFELFCAMIGALAFAGMMAVFPTVLVLKIWFGVMAIAAVVHIAVEPAKAYPIQWPKRPRS